MAKDLNRVELLGRLGADPELRLTDRGSALATFNLATSRRWKDAAGEDQEETEWSRCVAWGKLGEICGQYLRKGSRVYLDGRLRTRRWEDDHGTAHVTTEIILEEMIMLDARSPDATTATDADHNVLDAAIEAPPLPTSFGGAND
jgi:single-strand DNA-binding protein